MFNLCIYPKANFDIWIAGLPYSQAPKTPRTLAQWAAQEGADIIYPLAMFNMSGAHKGNTIQFVRGKSGDIGYGGSDYVLGLNPLEMMYGANKAGTHTQACAGYKTALVNGCIYPGLDKLSRRSRNANGIMKNGEYFHLLTGKGVTEYECAQFLKEAGAHFALMQDGGGTTAKWQDGKVVFKPEGGRATTNVVCIKRKNVKDEGKNMKVKCNVKTAVYDASGKVEPRRYIDKGDICTLGALTDRLTVEVVYPVAGGTRAAFIKDLGNFILG